MVSKLLAGGGFSIAPTDSPMPIVSSTPSSPIVPFGVTAPAKLSWFGANWWWLLLIALLIVLGIYFWRKGVMNKK